MHLIFYLIHEFDVHLSYFFFLYEIFVLLYHIYYFFFSLSFLMLVWIGQEAFTKFFPYHIENHLFYVSISLTH